MHSQSPFSASLTEGSVQITTRSRKLYIGNDMLGICISPAWHRVFLFKPGASSYKLMNHC